MNQTASRYRAELTLKSSAELPRMLLLQLSASQLCASVFCQDVIFVSNAYGVLAQCYLDTSTRGFEFLSIDRASFRVCEAEVTQIRAALEPLGLQVREAS